MSEYIYKRERVADGVFTAESTGEEIVRCRDCKHLSRDEKIYRECYRLHGYNSFTVEEYGFCAWGKRRES